MGVTVVVPIDVICTRYSTYDLWDHARSAHLTGPPLVQLKVDLCIHSDLCTRYRASRRRLATSRAMCSRRATPLLPRTLTRSYRWPDQ